MASRPKAACGPAEKQPRKTAAERVFETARELFYRRGVRAVGVDEIVCTAGVTKPSLYRAFASKDELVAACLQDSGQEGINELDALIAAAPDEPAARIRAVVRHYADMIAGPDFRGCPLSNTAVEFPEPGHPGRPVIETCKLEVRARLVHLARALPGRDPEALADGIVLLIEGAMASHHVFGSQGPSLALSAAADALIAAHAAAGAVTA